jgi:organic hydroperoxide reductase OsmC/OhrA
MSTYHCNVQWARRGEAFTDLKYSRAHEWRFDGGAVVPGSSSPLSVRPPYSDPSAVDPEEALVAAVSSCHMLWFLSLAAQDGFVVDQYQDAAEGLMGTFADGKAGITQVVLRPQVTLSGARAPDDAAISHLHHLAHERCNVGNSLRGEVRVDGRWSRAGE